jgi:hypothetical protein
MSNQNKPIRAYETFYTNIKGLPEGDYMTETLYSDTTPWAIVGGTAKTVIVQEVLVKRDPDWQPVIHAGGFAGHCSNQDEQTWLFDRLGKRTKTLRLKKSRYHGSDKLWGGADGSEFIANGAVNKHDYNF